MPEAGQGELFGAGSPPTVSRASKTATEKPRRASSTAAVSPFGPAPTTTASSIDGTSDPFVNQTATEIRI